VLSAESGYTGGHTPDPDYEAVSTGQTGHVEAVRVIYDPTTISYENLVRVFLQNINPTDQGGQFADRGSQYRTAIFYDGEDQKRVAEAVLAETAASGRFKVPLTVPLRPAVRFPPAEDYPQDYYKKNAVRYDVYHRASGRGPYLESVWGRSGHQGSSGGQAGPPSGYVRPDDDELRRRLSPLAFAVTRKNATEPPFDNAYWNEKRPGLYVDAVSGEPLFSSRDKFDSGTGWPSFTRSVAPGAVVEREDTSLFQARIGAMSSTTGPRRPGNATASIPRHCASYPWRRWRRRGTADSSPGSLRNLAVRPAQIHFFSLKSVKSPPDMSSMIPMARG
jgi:peptide methionine sulfoxide reductase msrA/msrB